MPQTLEEIIVRCASNKLNALLIYIEDIEVLGLSGAGEEINFDVFRAFVDQGIQFSLPLRVTHTSIDSQEKPVDGKLMEPQSAT